MNLTGAEATRPGPQDATVSESAQIRRALISVSDKTDLVPFARQLVAFGVEIISTGGTARALTDAGVEVLPVAQVTGFPEIMDGRVKTLHPAVHGAILGRRDIETHRQAMAEHGITPIDLVCINLYPFEQTVRREGVTAAEAIEQIDIGGPAMLRSAAKNHASVTVVTSASQFDRVITTMRDHGGATTPDLRRELAAAAFTRTAEYDTSISAWMIASTGEAFPPMLRLGYAHRRDLRYGENPHQRAALYSDPTAGGPSIVAAEQVHGRPLSYNNINDAAAALALVQDLDNALADKACAVILKHTNPCGAAACDALPAAFEAAFAGDPSAAYGGILAVNGDLDDTTAERICDGERFLEVIVAPSFDDAATARLGSRWKNVRLLATGNLTGPSRDRVSYRSIAGGMLAQDRDLRLANTREWTHAAGPAPSDDDIATAAFAWTLAKHLTSNAIAIAAGGALLGAGAGQVDRVTACRLAIEKAGDRLAAVPPAGAGRAVAASDAFFPFADGPRSLIDAGVGCIVQPGGSKRDQDTFDLCNERGVTCLLTGVRHFRH